MHAKQVILKCASNSQTVKITKNIGYVSVR